MMSIKRCYAELLSLTQLFLLREYALQDVKRVDPAVLTFFQNKMRSFFPQPLPKKPQPPLFVQEASMQVYNPQSTWPPLRADSGTPSQSLAAAAPQPLPKAAKLTEECITSIPPPEPPPAMMQQDKVGKDKKFSLEPLAAPIASSDYREFWKLCQTLFPNWTLCEKAPSDAVAKDNKNAWLREQEIPPVVILSFHDNEQQVTFLKNIAQAIALRLAPARVLLASKLEKENGWESVLNSPQLRLVIASDYGLYLQPKLISFYREVPQQNKHFLNQTPLLLLSDLALYLKEPQLKPLLWRAICNEFTASQLQR